MIEDINITRCTCDVCQHSEDVIGHKPTPLVTLYLPVDSCDEYGNYEFITRQEVEVCKDCLKEIHKALSEHYRMQLIKYGGLEIEKK